MTKVTCKIEGCEEPVHAKGYCRKHYAKMWRAKGKNEGAAGEGGKGGKKRRAVLERIRALGYELETAKRMYNSVVGVDTRLKWKKRIRWLEDEIRALESGVEDV